MVEFACLFEYRIRAERQDDNSQDIVGLRVAAARKAFAIQGEIEQEKRCFELAADRFINSRRDFQTKGAFTDGQIDMLMQDIKDPDKAEHQAKLEKLEADLEFLNTFVAAQHEFDLDKLKAILGGFEAAMQLPPKLVVNSIPVTRY